MVGGWAHFWEGASGEIGIMTLFFGADPPNWTSGVDMEEEDKALAFCALEHCLLGFLGKVA